MKKHIIAVMCFTALLLSGAAANAAWFGEASAQRETVNLEFRGTFVQIVYYLLYGTFTGKQTDSGLLGLYQNLDGMVLMNPPLAYKMIYQTIRYFIIILEPLYVMVFLCVCIYLMFLSGSPQGRTRAKNLLPLLMASIVALSLSYQILEIMFNASYELCTGIVAAGKIDMGGLFIETIDDLARFFSAATLTSFEGGIFFLVLIFALTMGLVTMLALRYVVLLFFAMLFPVGLFLYTIKGTRSIGRVMVEQTVLWTFVQVAITLIIATTSIGVDLLGIIGDLKTILGITAFIASIASPIILLTLIKRFLP
jgi:hypothetical protein